MATLAGNLQHKLVSQTQPGELFRMRVRQSSGLCVNIEPAAPRFVRVGLLKSPDIDYPCTFAAEANAPCLSYGTVSIGAQT